MPSTILVLLVLFVSFAIAFAVGEWIVRWMERRATDDYSAR